MSNETVNVEAALRTDFRKRFGAAPTLARAPGRVNLIGDHTDYNGGLVMPAAIAFYSWVAAHPREDGCFSVYSAQFDETVQRPLSEIARHRPGSGAAHWADYPLGVAACLVEAGIPLTGACMSIAGNVPLGAGLSSSASLEVATAGALLAMLGQQLDPRQIALLCQRAENEYVGMRCGVMDQYIAVFGRAQFALELDCERLEHRLIPLSAGADAPAQLLICDSMVKHTLASSEYNRRRSECETALAALRGAMPGLSSLSDLDTQTLDGHASLLDATQLRRTRHVVTENRRVREAAEALQRGQLADVGRLMYESHASLRDDYQVSCAEMDCLVDAARGIEGTLGARMTGGGFGGCTVNLVRTDSVADFEQQLSRRYRDTFGIEPRIFRCESADGLTQLPGAIDG